VYGKNRYGVLELLPFPHFNSLSVEAKTWYIIFIGCMIKSSKGFLKVISDTKPGLRIIIKISLLWLVTIMGSTYLLSVLVGSITSFKRGRLIHIRYHRRSMTMHIALY